VLLITVPFEGSFESFVLSTEESEQSDEGEEI
jgi:hypothetical protein